MLKTAAIATSLILAVGSAHAATSVSIPVQVNVSAECEIRNFNGGSVIDVSLSSSGKQIGGAVFVTCNDQLPYKLEADTNAAGQITVTDDNTGKDYPVKVTQGSGMGTTTVFSTDANGGAISGIGTGSSTSHQFQLGFNNDFSQGAPKMPQAGVYVGSLDITVVY